MGKKKINNVFPAVSPQAALNALLILAAVAATVMVFVLMEKYIREKVFVFRNGAALELVDVPSWVNRTLKQKVYDAAIAGGEDFKLDENAARLIQENIASKVAWLDNPQVQVTRNSFRVRGKWRRPFGIIKAGTDKKFYIDADLVVLDFVPVSKLPVITIRGVKTTSAPEPGEHLEQEDLAAAVALLKQLDRMDRIACPKKPLLYEIESIDVSNFNGRQSDKFPHIVLFSKDNTQIIWGAELNKWHRHLEATDEEKLAKLYSYYKENHSLSGKMQCINLRDPQEIIQPIDKE